MKISQTRITVERYRERVVSQGGPCPKCGYAEKEPEKAAATEFVSKGRTDQVTQVYEQKGVVVK